MKIRTLSLVVAALLGSVSTSAQSAPPDIKPSPSTPVQVMNDDSAPVPVNVVPTTRPFAKLLCLTDIPGGCDATASRPELPHSFVVPATTAGGEPVKGLVVEFVSGTCVGLGRSTFVEIDGTPGAGVLTNPDTGDNFSINRLPLSVAQFLQPPGVNGAQAFAQSSRMYFDPGTNVAMTFDIVASGGIVCRTQLNGHLVVQ